jgi:hypothetical protein
MNPAQNALLEKRDGWDVGRDPRQVSREELIAAGHKPMSPLKALRARCIDCCADQPSEVRLCTAVACPSWPFRTGKNVWARERSEAQRDAARKAGAIRRARMPRQPENPCSTQGADATAEGVATILPPATLSTDEIPVSDVQARAAAGVEAQR